MDIQFSGQWQIVVNDKWHLLDIQSSSPNISRNENTTVSSPELTHDLISFFLGHISAHAGNSKVILSHLICEPLNFVSLITEYHSLGDCQSVIEVTKSIKFPLFLIYLDEKLFNSFQCQLITLHQNLNWVFHELLSHIQNFLRHGSWNNHVLRVVGQVSVNVVNLIFKSFYEHLISLIDDKHFQRSSSQLFPLDHVVYSPRCSWYHMNSMLQFANVILNWVAP